MSWKGIVNVTFPSHLQTLMALFPKSKVLKGQVSHSDKFSLTERVPEGNSFAPGRLASGDSGAIETLKKYCMDPKARLTLKMGLGNYNCTLSGKTRLLVVLLFSHFLVILKTSL